MTFKQWLHQYLGSNTHVIDFAKEACSDKHFPHKNDYAYILHYLEKQHIGEFGMRCFKETWELYGGSIPTYSED